MLLLSALQYSINLAMQDARTRTIYQSMTAQMKVYHKLRAQELAQPLKIVIAQSSEKDFTAKGMLMNVEELATALELQGYSAQVCLFRPGTAL